MGIFVGNLLPARELSPNTSAKEGTMDNTTLIVIIIILFLVFGGGWYGRGRWY